jgi:PAS domain S-box-containing protein
MFLMTSNEMVSQSIKDLVESKVHLRQIAENIEQVFWISDIASDRILYVNPAFTAVWGRSCDSLYADPSILIESVHPEDRVQFLVARSQSDHTPFNHTFRIVRPDGSLRWIYARTFVIFEALTDISYQVSVIQDVTSQNQLDQSLQKALDRSREQFTLSRKMSLVHKPEAVLKTLMSAHELHFAQRASLLFFDTPGVGPASGIEVAATWQPNQNMAAWVGESSLYEEPSFWELLQPYRPVVIATTPSDPRLSPAVHEYLSENQTQTLAIFPIVSTGIWLGCILIYFNQEHSFGYVELRHVKVLVDQATITLYNLKLLEVEEESRHEAERANAIKTEFLAMISHELRTPLTSIMGFATTLLADDVVWEPEEQRDFIQTIQQETTRLQELIDHLLDLSRLEAGRLPIVIKPHSLQEIIDDALPQFRSLTGNHIFSVRLPDNLPLVNVDPKRIAQVLVNLIRNASAYAPPGTEIAISALLRAKVVQINVIDQGPGIPAGEQKKVFKAFQRGENTENGAAKGAGLGLAICKGLVEAHGGRIWIKKKTTHGATISFTIPLVASQETSPETAEKEQ